MCTLLSVALATILTIIQAAELKNIPLDIRSDTKNWGFILFFICFFIAASIINYQGKFLRTTFNRLFSNNDRFHMFQEDVANETMNKIVLSLITVFMLSIIFYSYVVHEQLTTVSSSTQMLILLGKSALLITGFLFYKFLSYAAIGAIFFKKELTLQWSDYFFSISSLNGIFLFFPALILFYVESAFYFCIYFIIFYLIANLFFIFYKIKTLFFQGNRYLLYFILYLCTQEIIPLYLVYFGFFHIIA